MTKYYGNKLWNDATSNTNKLVIHIPKEELVKIINSLNVLGVNYYAYSIDNNPIVHLAISSEDIEIYKIADTQADNRYTYKPTITKPVVSVVGNIAYRNIKNKHYARYNSSFACQLALLLDRDGIDYSGRITSQTSTITVDESDAARLKEIADELKHRKEFINANKSVMLYADTDISKFYGVSALSIEMTNDEFKKLAQNLDVNNIPYAALTASDSSIIFFDESMSEEVQTVVNEYIDNANLSKTLLYALRACELNTKRLDPLESAINLFTEKFKDEYFVESFIKAFKGCSEFTDDQLSELANMFASVHRNIIGGRHLYDDVVPRLKNQIKKRIQLDKFAEDRKLSDEQKAAVERMMNDNVGKTILNLVDYTFTPTQIDRLRLAKNFDEIVSVISDVKSISESSANYELTHGTYHSEIPPAKDEGVDESGEQYSESVNKLNQQKDTTENKEPYFICQWSEHSAFEDGKKYSVAEFDSLMKAADEEWVTERQRELDVYGNDIDKIYEAYDRGEIDGIHQGYAKTQFTLVMPDGTEYTERQDIGDGDGGVIDFLSRYKGYGNIVSILKATIKGDGRGAQESQEVIASEASEQSIWDKYLIANAENVSVTNCLLYQIGDFYEVMGENAPIVADVLGLSVTTRNTGHGGTVPMCGFPAYKLEENVNKLTERGYDVAVSTLENGQHITRVILSNNNVLSNGNDISEALTDEELNELPISVVEDGKVVTYPNAEAMEEASAESNIQLEYFDRSNEDRSIDFLHEDSDIKLILLTTPYLKASKDDIAKYFESARDRKEQTEYIKSIFNNNLTEITVPDGRKMGYKTYQNVLHMWEGSFDNITKQSYYDWAVIAGYFDGMRLLNELSDTAKPLPPMEAQLNIFNKERETTSPAFSFSQEIIDTVLTRGSGFEEGKMRIYEQFQKSISQKENISFLIAEYGVGGTYPVITGTGIAESHDGKGIQLSKGYENDTPKLTLSWAQIEKRIGELIHEDKYLNTREKERYPVWLEEQKQHRAEIDKKSEINDEFIFPSSSVKDASEIGKSKHKSAPTPQVLNLFDVAEQNSEINDRNTERSSIDEVINMDFDDDNFVIEDNNAAVGAKTKFKNNINAISTLKKVESKSRAATNEEKRAMSLYSGWGGLAQAFDDTKDNWADEYKELKELLTDEEYSSARASVLDSFYTSNDIIDSIYTVLHNNGFAGGDILEPAMGIGNFFGRMPSEITRLSNLYGVEKDSISGRIADKLFPDANITIDGFENTNFQDGSFDIVIGNIPFGDFGVDDTKYNSQNLKIHDYFFVKALDKVRDGGIVAFVTSKGTLDKKDSSFRKLLAEKADLIGAVRLPNNAFKAAGTQVTSDIIFLQKRSKAPTEPPRWVNLTETSDGYKINSYFEEHPEMVLGKIVKGNKLYGRDDDTMCVPFDYADLSELLNKAVANIKFTYTDSPYKPSPLAEREKTDVSLVTLPEKIRNESYFEYNGNVYFYGTDNQKNMKIFTASELWGEMNEKKFNVNASCVKSYIKIRDTLRNILEAEQQPITKETDSRINQLQAELNTNYDEFYKTFGLIQSTVNRRILSLDNSYYLACSLEFETDNGKLIKKAPVFTERTVSPPRSIESVDTALEALNVSIVEHGCIDLPYMSSLCGLPKEAIIANLKGVMYPEPELSSDENIVYVTKSEYLSGDIYQKLDIAVMAAKQNPIFNDNIAALQDVIPEPIPAADIDVNIGATWIPLEIYRQFMYEVFKTPNEYRVDKPRRFFYSRYTPIDIEYTPYGERWKISNKSVDSSVTVRSEFGVENRNAYVIFENLLNFTETKLYKNATDKNGHIIYDSDGNPKRVLDVQRTKAAQQKAKLIQNCFKDWIFKDLERRKTLTAKYNREFNCLCSRKFDGSKLTFPGMNNAIELRPHQKDAVARAIYGGNTLFAHTVGAGKTFEMIATAMECKRLGFCTKSMFAVPNHLTEQFAADFLKLYPFANILVTTKRDFQKDNRKRLLSKIATGNYDAVIIGHSQLKMIPMSPQYERKILQQQISEIVEDIKALKRQSGSSFSVKAMERTKKGLEKRIKNLQVKNQDDMLYFEELGIDKLFVDEAHEFKNLFCVTKLQNVAGVSSNASQRAMDLFMKCRYLDNKTNSKGVVFATGTPISNSITEAHTMMRYLQYDFLTSHNNMQSFDAWISTFGKTITDYELDPTGTRFREKTRIAEYRNLPELVSLFRQVADIKMSDELVLDVPECNLHIEKCAPTELQQDLVSELSQRADDINSGAVDPSVDNFLKITSDGRKVGLDPRLINPNFPDDERTTLNRCVENVANIYTKTSDERLTQLIFCDIGVPKPTKKPSTKIESVDDKESTLIADTTEEYCEFSVYQDIKDKLIKKGIPNKEIAFIHDANTETKKAELFEKVRTGDVRILIGSTGKMGTGTNVQNKLVALHDLDVPWRPADLDQRRGRMVRQFNTNKEVDLYRYITEGTFDAYSYQILENKQRYIAQIMTSKNPSRTCTDVDKESLQYSEIKALCTGDPRIREKLTLENRVKELDMLRKEDMNIKYKLQEDMLHFPQRIQKLEETINGIKSDIARFENLPCINEKPIFSMRIGKDYFEKRTEAAEAFLTACHCVKSEKNKNSSFAVGELFGFQVTVKCDDWGTFKATIHGAEKYSVQFTEDSARGNLTKVENIFHKLSDLCKAKESELAQMKMDFESAQKLKDIPFEFETEYQEKRLHLDELTEELNEKAKSVLQGKTKPVRTRHFDNSKRYKKDDSTR